ncbi:MAG: SGNH/GDSL hydrolase family protein [Myxococcales bacterium]|nr:SGNH/GDSL hydrolase family protein [Myxococcales bacterium]
MPALKVTNRSVRILGFVCVVALISGCSDDSEPAGNERVAPDTGPLDVATGDVEQDAEAVSDVVDENEDTAEGSTPDAVIDAGPRTYAGCFADTLGRFEQVPDYDRYGPVIGSHCLGTNHQDIVDVQKVVFFGDSVTVGTPPSFEEEYYRTILSNRLRERFGESLVVESYARFGARTDDLLLPSDEQLIRAFPEPEELRTLVVMTIGGNDLYRWIEMFNDGASRDEISAKVDESIAQMRDAIEWLVEPGRFTNGVYVLFANTYEFTDGTGDTLVCEIAPSIGLTEPWPQGQEFVIRYNEAFLEIAVDTQTDMIFLQEEFCGHGFNAANPEAPCYRGPDTEVWFDFTCIHPNPAGHARMAEMFEALIAE